jgi:FixJ family two-component response regulator
MTGAQLAERIKTQQPDLPIILATGFAELAQSSHLELLRLNKPFDQTTLARALSEGLKLTGRRTVVPFRPRQG